MDGRVDRRGGVWNALPWSLRYAGVAAACVLLASGVAYLILRLAVLVAPLTMALVAALVLTALLQPVSAVLRRGHVPAALAALAAIGVLLAVLVLPAVLMWPTVADQAADLPDQLSQGWSRTQDWLVDTFGLSESQLSSAIDQISAQARSSAPDPVGSAMTVVEGVGAALLALVLIFFLLKDGPAMARWFGGLLPQRSRDRWMSAAGNGWQALARYARGTVAVAAIDAVGIGAALFAVGVPLALPLTILTFLAAFVPILGATVAGVAAVLVALAANGPADALIVLAAVVVVQQLEGNLLEPLIMGRALRLHPVVVLIAVTAGGLTGGIAGAIVAVPLTAVVYQVARTMRQSESEPEPSVDPVTHTDDGRVGEPLPTVPDER